MKTRVERAESRAFLLGLLWAASFMCDAYDQPTMAQTMLRDSNVPISTLQKIARVGGYTFKRGFWADLVANHP